LSSPIKITVSAADEISRLPLSKKDARELVGMVCKAENITHATVSVVFVGAGRMQELNNRYLQHNYPTDVIAFGLQEEGEALDGEVYVCMETAFGQAAEFNVTFREELIRLVVHGTLHLIGYDDGAEEERREMIEHGELYVRRFMKSGH